MRRAILLLVVSLLQCRNRGDVISDRPGQQLPPSSNGSGLLTLQKARSILASRVEGSRLGTIVLDGYSFHRVIEIGGGITLMIISCNLGGGIATFSANGTNIVTRPTHEIIDAQFIDLDENGIDELVTDEIDGRGTGLLERTFRIYRLSPSGIDQIWQGKSYSLHAPDEAHFSETFGLLHFDRSGAGQPARLIHATLQDGRWTTTTWQMSGAKLVRAANADSR